jgi:hypothetical protein
MAFLDIDEAEASIPFHQHILLDGYLADFPDIEPVQRFMQLVLHGISLNSHMTWSEKREIIEWYRVYFEENAQLIRDAISAERYTDGLETTANFSANT